MDQPFPLALLRPTVAIKRPDSPLNTDNSEDKQVLVDRLRDQTKAIHKSPYDPSLWISRSETLEDLGFPELAVGDHWKADRLCQHMKTFLDPHTDSRWRLGSKRGFWMLHDDESGTKEPIGCGSSATLGVSLDVARNSMNPHLVRFWNGAKGVFVPQAYPWLSAQHAERSDELVVELNRELARNIVQQLGRSCEIRRCMFESSDDDTDAASGLGVFALHDMPKGTKLLIDKSVIFGCIGPGSDGSSKKLHSGKGCLEPLHPNIEDEDAIMDLRWIRDRLGTNVAETIMLCRALLACVQQGVKHPFDQSDIARLTPTYHLQDTKYFWLDNDIAVPNEALQQFGIDVFANANYDTWVLCTIAARLDNNTWSDPSTSCLNSLFSLFNHSCSPNVKWTTQEDHLTVSMRTAKDVRAGDQLFVEYDSFMHDHSLDERRARLTRWINGPCMCERCVQESKDISAKEVGSERKAMEQAYYDGLQAQVLTSFNGASDGNEVQTRPHWDDSEQFVLPEDFPSYWR